MSNNVLLTVAPSHTEEKITELIVSPEYLANGERVLIIDDFLASGATISGLVRLTQTAGATLVGCTHTGKGLKTSKSGCDFHSGTFQSWFIDTAHRG